MILLFFERTLLALDILSWICYIAIGVCVVFILYNIFLPKINKILKRNK